MKVIQTLALITIIILGIVLYYLIVNLQKTIDISNLLTSTNVEICQEN